MTIDKRRKDLDDDRLKIGIAFGFGFSNPEAGSFAEVSESTAKRVKTNPEIVRVTEAVASALSIYKSKQLKNAVTEAVGSAEDRIKRLFDRSLRLSERALERAEEQGDQISYEQLVEIHETFTKWASKYTVSEAPKRMEFEGKQTTTHVHVLSLAEAGNIWERRKQIQSGRSLVEGEPNVIDVNPV